MRYLVIFFGLVLLSCTSSSGQPPAPTVDSKARFEAIWGRAEFNVAFDVTDGYPYRGQRQFVWARRSGAVRLDEVTASDKDPLGGWSVFSDKSGNLSCEWVAPPNGSPGGVVCYESDPGLVVGAVLDISRPGLSYVASLSHREILGNPAECFAVKSSHYVGEICLSGDGLPLSLKALDPSTGQVEVSMIATRIEPVSGGRPLQPLVDWDPRRRESQQVSLADLRLPPAPMLDPILSPAE